MPETDWMVLELNEMGDVAPYLDIKQAIFELFGEKCDYFIPIHYEEMGSYVSTSVLFQGYVFVRKTQESLDKLVGLCDSRLFNKALEARGKLQTINSRTIGVLKTKLKNSTKKRLKPGTRVRVLEGTFKNLVGEVLGLEDGGKRAIIKISRLSREMIAPIPSTSIEVYVEGGPC